MNDAELIELVAKILVIDSGRISLESDLESLGWDSLSNLSFISELDERLNLQVNAGQLGKASTVRHLRELLAE